jgi:hypothetical protein
MFSIDAQARRFIKNRAAAVVIEYNFEAALGG